MVCHSTCISSSHFQSGDVCIQNWKQQHLYGYIPMSILEIAWATLELSLPGKLGEPECLRP